jgi:hypothetical protein
VCNNVDPSSDAFVSELRITSPGKDILPDLVARVSGEREKERERERERERE